MTFMQISKMKKNLTPEEQEGFKAALERFYAAPPDDLVVLADYVAVDESRSFTLVEIHDIERLHEINEPFAPFVDYEVFAVRPAN
jgi:hypothetical protein